MLVFAAACALGAVAGLAFAALWLLVVPPGTAKRFWSAMSSLTREALQTDDARAFFALYRRLGALVGGYLARNLGGTVLGCLPMILILLTVAPLVFEAREGGAVRRYCASSALCLSDIEAAFFAAFALATLAGLLWPRSSKRTTTPSYN